MDIPVAGRFGHLPKVQTCRNSGHGAWAYYSIFKDIIKMKHTIVTFSREDKYKMSLDDAHYSIVVLAIASFILITFVVATLWCMT